MTINETIKEFRERTGIGMVEAKKILEVTNYSLDEAIMILEQLSFGSNVKLRGKNIKEIYNELLKGSE